MADEWWEVKDEEDDDMYDDMFTSNLSKSTDTYDENDAFPVQQSPCLGLVSQRDWSHLKMPPQLLALLKPGDPRLLKYQKESCNVLTVNNQRITVTTGSNKNQATDLAAGDMHFRNGTVGKRETKNGAGQIDRVKPFAWLSNVVTQNQIANNRKKTVPSAYSDINVDHDIHGGRFFSSQVKKLPVADKVNSWLQSGKNCSEPECTASQYRPSTADATVKGDRKDNGHGASLPSQPASSPFKMTIKHLETTDSSKVRNVQKDEAIPCTVPNIPVRVPTNEPKKPEKKPEDVQTPSTIPPIASALQPDKVKVDAKCEAKPSQVQSPDVLNTVPDTNESKLPSSTTSLPLEDLSLNPKTPAKLQLQNSSNSSVVPFVNDAKRASTSPAGAPMHYAQSNAPASARYLMAPLVPPGQIMPLPFCPGLYPTPTANMMAPPGFGYMYRPPPPVGPWQSNNAGSYLNPNAASFTNNYGLPSGRQSTYPSVPPPSKAVITELKPDTGNVENAKHIIMFDNLPVAIDEAELRKTLEGFGKIAHVQIIKKGSSCAAFARVTDLEMACWIVSTLDESLIDGMPMRVWLKK